MNNEIINCYDLDIKQDIPEEFRIIKTDNESLIHSNKIFKGIMMGIGIGVCIYLVYNFTIKKKEKV
jgi:hypothetical protein